MGRRGPAPTPTKLKMLRGETRPSRVNHREPKPRPNDPIKPSDLDAEAEEVWDRVVTEYGHTGVITAADTDALRAYCEAVARYRQAAGLLRQSGPLIKSKRTGEFVKNPLHQITRDNADLMRQYARELGLTPSARTGLQGKEREAPSKLADFLGRRPA